MPEYLAIYNPDLEDIDISGFRFTNGIKHTFPDGTILAAGDTMYISESDGPVWWNLTTNVQGWGSGKLSNKGETIQFEDNFGLIIDHVKYYPEAPWPTDGVLVLKNISLDNHFADNWTSIIDDRSVPEISKKKIFVYPNPARGNVTLWASEELQSDFVNILQFNGQLIDTIELDGNREVKIDMIKYPNGMLLLNVGGKTIKVVNLSR